MRRINVRYRCSVCGLEIRLTLAPDEDPPPPRHCLEDMEMIAPVFE
jgi:rubredoxin